MDYNPLQDYNADIKEIETKLIEISRLLISELEKYPLEYVDVKLQDSLDAEKTSEYLEKRKQAYLLYAPVMLDLTIQLEKLLNMGEIRYGQGGH